MKKSIFVGLTLSLTSLLFSCAQQKITPTEAKVILSTIEENLNNPTFEYPTKITINKIYRKGETMIDRLNIRFSLDDYYFYIAKGVDNSIVTEKWTYADKLTESIYTFESTSTKNDGKINYYKVSKEPSYKDYFFNLYDEVKNVINESIVQGNDTLENDAPLIESELEHNKEAQLDITTSGEYNIELIAKLSTKEIAIDSHIVYKDSLPTTTSVYKKINDIEDVNFETKYYYNSCNVTKPSVNDFVETK